MKKNSLTASNIFDENQRFLFFKLEGFRETKKRDVFRRVLIEQILVNELLLFFLNFHYLTFSL